MGEHPPTLGLILAGGRARRMGGGDKALLRLGGRTLLDRVVDRLRPQCSALILSANGDPRRFGSVNVPIVPDDLAGWAGPLAGILAGLDWAAANHPGAAWVASVAADTPLIPDDLVARLHLARRSAGAVLACAASGGRDHPVNAIWPVSLAARLRGALSDGERRVGRFAETCGCARAIWDGGDDDDPFFNINEPADLDAARARLAGSATEGRSHLGSPRASSPREGEGGRDETARRLDLRGLKCPLPALRTRKALAGLAAGETLAVTCTDPMAAIDIPNLLRETGDTLDRSFQDGELLTFRITRGRRARGSGG